MIGCPEKNRVLDKSRSFSVSFRILPPLLAIVRPRPSFFELFESLSIFSIGGLIQMSSESSICLSFSGSHSSAFTATSYRNNGVLFSRTAHGRFLIPADSLIFFTQFYMIGFINGSGVPYRRFASA